MDDLEYYKGVDELLEVLLKNAPKSFGIDFGLLNDVLIETSKRKMQSVEDVLCGKTT